MYLLRLLILAAIVWLVLRLIRNYRARQAAVTHKPARKVGTMVPCAHCGLHVPEQDAIRVGDDFYCSPEHRAAGKRT